MDVPVPLSIYILNHERHDCQAFNYIYRTDNQSFKKNTLDFLSIWNDYMYLLVNHTYQELCFSRPAPPVRINLKRRDQDLNSLCQLNWDHTCSCISAHASCSCNQIKARELGCPRFFVYILSHERHDYYYQTRSTAILITVYSSDNRSFEKNSLKLIKQLHQVEWLHLFRLIRSCRNFTLSRRALPVWIDLKRRDQDLNSLCQLNQAHACSSFCPWGYTVTTSC